MLPHVNPIEVTASIHICKHCFAKVSRELDAEEDAAMDAGDVDLEEYDNQ